MNNISNNMKYYNYCHNKCNHYCNNAYKKCNFYDWFGFFDNRFIKRMCESCALRETWGYHYKQTKGFKKWAS